MSTALVAAGLVLAFMVVGTGAFILGAILAAGKAEDDFREMRDQEMNRAAFRRIVGGDS